MSKWMRRGLGFLAIAVLAVVVIGWGAITSQPEITRDWVGDLNELRASLEPEGEPAWPIYREIIVSDFGIESGEDERPSDLLERFLAILRDRDRLGPAEPDWGDPAHDGFRALLHELDPTLRKLDVAAELPRMGKPYIRKGDAITGEGDPSELRVGVQVLLPELRRLRQLASMNLVRIRSAAGRGDWDAYADHLASALALADHTATGTLIEAMVGTRMADVALNELRYELSPGSVPAVAARRMDATIGARVRPLEWGAEAMEVERLVAVSSLDMIYGVNGYLASWGVDENFERAEATLPDRLLNVLALTQPKKAEVIATFDAAYAEAQGAIAGDAEELARVIERFDDYETDAFAVGMLLPAMGRFVRNVNETERDARATRIMLRLEAIYGETGEWPADLSAPELAELNEDPLTGEAFVYELTPDDPNGRATPCTRRRRRGRISAARTSPSRGRR